MGQFKLGVKRLRDELERKTKGLKKNYDDQRTRNYGINQRAEKKANNRL